MELNTFLFYFLGIWTVAGALLFFWVVFWAASTDTKEFHSGRSFIFFLLIGPWGWILISVACLWAFLDFISMWLKNKQ